MVGLAGQSRKLDDLAEDGDGRENVLSNEQFLLTEKVDQEIPDLDNILDDFNRDREDIRAVIPPLLQSSGLLLSISLGAIYFILNDGSRMGIHFFWIIFFLFLAVVFLAVSIVSGVWALYKKPPADGVKNKDRVEHERKNRRKDQIYTRGSTFALIVAVLAILIALCILYWESGNTNISSNSTEKKDSLIIVFAGCPNLSNSSHELNGTYSDFINEVLRGPYSTGNALSVTKNLI